MKKQILLCSISLFCFFVSMAQVQKKDILIGGTFGYNAQSSSSDNGSTNANINPTIGYAVGNNSVLSLKGGYSFGKNEGTYTTSYSGFSIGMSWKKFFSIKEKIGWFTDVYGLFNDNKIKQDYPGSPGTSTSNGYTVGGKPGIYFLPASNILLTADIGGISYSSDRSTNTAMQKSKSSSLNIGLLNSFSLGIHFIINKRKSEG